MPHPPLTAEEVKQRAEQLYAQKLLPEVETDDNIGKIIVIDTDTGNYEIAEDGLTANKRLQAKHPDIDPHALFAIRIGYNAVYSLGGVLTRTKL